MQQDTHGDGEASYSYERAYDSRPTGEQTCAGWDRYGLEDEWSPTRHGGAIDMSDRSEVERLTLSMLVRDVESVRHVLACIDDVGPTVQLESMTVETPEQSNVKVAVDEITPKQWEALTLAFEKGYYDRPRDVDLKELADELAISKSAVSQRLRAAEATLIESIVTERQPVLADG